MRTKLYSKRSLLIGSIFFLIIISSIPIPDVEADNEQMPLCNTFTQFCSIVGYFFWSRDSAEGHRQELICDQFFPERCLIPYFFDSNVDDIGMTLTSINDEADNSDNVINSITKNIGVIRAPETSIHDNRIDSGSLTPGVTALYSGDRHCLNIFCTEKDDHIDKFFIRLNSDSSINFDTFETCDNPPTPTVWNLEKTLNHEFFHMLAFGHNIPDDNSIVAFAGYVCGQAGLKPTFHDIEVVLEKYGGDWFIESDYTMTLGHVSEDTMTIPENVIVRDNALLTIESPLTLEIDFANHNLTVESGSGIMINSGAKISSPP